MNYPKLDLFDIVELRGGRLAVVLLVSDDPDEKNLALYSRSHTSVNPQLIKVDEYNDQLYTVGYDEEIAVDYDIMKILKYTSVRDVRGFSTAAYMRLITDILVPRYPLFFKEDDLSFKPGYVERRITPFGWTWVREECKEVTMAEVEEKFGCKVKIIKGDL